MNLEDHLGDIIRKARMMAGVSTAAAAKAAGLSAAEFGALESTGRCNQTPKLGALARLIGLDGPKLEGIANGWLPAAVDLRRWRELRVITTADEDMTVNCFLIWDATTREAAVFDTGFDVAPVIRAVEENQLQLRHVFITHGHSDHVDGLPTLHARFANAQLHLDSRSAPTEYQNRRDDCISLGCLRVTNRPTPGHADDGVTYLVDGWPGQAPQVAIVGDALFAGSAGRAMGGWETARRAVVEQVLSLPPNTLLCPGHGPLTTVAEETAHNPFF
jgi:hydroxyacylglutathione hydrolase